MATNKEILEEKVKKFEDIKGKEDELFQVLSSLNISGDTESKINSVFEDIYGALLKEDNSKEKGNRVCVCGEKDHEPGAKFCHKCGGKLEIPKPQEEKREERKPKVEANTEIITSVGMDTQSDQSTEQENDENGKNGEENERNNGSIRNDEGNLIDKNGQYLIDFKDEE